MKNRITKHGQFSHYKQDLFDFSILKGLYQILKFFIHIFQILFGTSYYKK